MTSFYGDPIDGASLAVLLSAFKEACARHDIPPDSEDGSDLLTVLMHAFRKGTTTEDALVALVMNLVGK